MIQWASHSHGQDRDAETLVRTALRCCTPIPGSVPLCCLRGGRAVQVMLPYTWQRATRDIDLYHATDLRCIEAMIEDLRSRTDHAEALTNVHVSGHPFAHETLSLPIRDVSLRLDGRHLSAQITQPSAWPSTRILPSGYGFSINVLDTPELVAEKLLKFSSHSIHRHNSRSEATYYKHLSDLFLLLTHCSPSPERCLLSCQRVLAHERRHEGSSPRLKQFLHDVEAVLSQYLTHLPQRSRGRSPLLHPPVTADETASYLTSAAIACQTWVNRLASTLGNVSAQ